MALPIASVVMPTGGVALRFEAEPQEICQHYLSKIDERGVISSSCMCEA